MFDYDVLVIGGGAAGFFAAITCAERSEGYRIGILEQARVVLGKVKISGGGRCNLTHACFDPEQLTGYYPRGNRELRGPFSRFQPRDTIEWFERRGVALKTEPDGRVFPVSDRSQTIIDCLIGQAQARGVEIRTGTTVEGVESGVDGGFRVATKGGWSYSAKRVLIATGGGPKPMGWAVVLRHRVIPPVPSLFTFMINDPRIENLSGISIPNGRVSLPEIGLEQSGPVLITHWGLSGPAVLALSAWGARELYNRDYHTRLSINWLGDEREATWTERILQQRMNFGRLSVGNHNPTPLAQRLWERLAIVAGVKDRRWGDLSRESIRRLGCELCEGEFYIRGKGVFKEEFVTCGGVALEDVNLKTMESRVLPGLYFAGEILNVDGITGGFNFQNAWTTGWIAGRAMGEERG